MGPCTMFSSSQSKKFHAMHLVDIERSCGSFRRTPLVRVKKSVS